MTLSIGWLHDGGETVGTWLHRAGDWHDPFFDEQALGVSTGGEKLLVAYQKYGAGPPYNTQRIAVRVIDPFASPSGGQAGECGADEGGSGQPVEAALLAWAVLVVPRAWRLSARVVVLEHQMVAATPPAAKLTVRRLQQYWGR